jgi:hypothetical protein
MATLIEILNGEETAIATVLNMFEDAPIVSREFGSSSSTSTKTYRVVTDKDWAPQDGAQYVIRKEVAEVSIGCLQVIPDFHKGLGYVMRVQEA